MATRTEVEDAEKNRADAIALEDLKARLVDLHDNGTNYDLKLTADGTTTSVSLLAFVEGLRTLDNDAIVTTLVSDLDASIQACIGSDDVTADTLRLAITTAVTSFDANITGT